MTKHTCKRHQAPTAPEPDGFAQWWAQWPSRTVAAGRRAHYAEAYDARTEEIERLRAGLLDAIEEVESWAAYASEYFLAKHDLDGALARLRSHLGPNGRGNRLAP